MKKFLLSVASVALCCMGAFAAPIVVDFSAAENLPADDAATDIATATINGVDFSFFHCKKGTYSGASYVQVSGKTYVDDDAAYIEFKSPESVSSFTVHTGGNASTNVLVTLTCNGVEVPQYVKLKLDKKDADFSFSIPESMQAAGTTYRLTTANKYNAQFSSFTLNPESGVVTPPTPDVPDTPNPATVEELKTENAAEIEGTDIPEKPAEGTSNGTGRHIQPLESLEIDGYIFTFTSGTNTSNAPAYYYPMSTSETGKTSIRIYSGNTMTITAPDNKKFTSLVAVPDNSNKEVVIYNGTEVNSFEYTATGTVRINVLKVGFGQGSDPVEPTYKEVNSIAETVKEADNSKVKVNYSTLVAYANGTNIFAQDEAGDFIQIYGANSYKADDIIPAGWNAEYTPYQGMPELKPVSLPASTEQGTFIPKRYKASDITEALANNVLVVEGINFAEATPATKTNFTGTSEAVSLTFRNNFTIDSVEAGDYDVTCVVQLYNKAIQLYPIAYFPADQSGVNAIASENGVAEYYNMQGVKVANPENGLYIVVKNGKAQKVLVK